MFPENSSFADYKLWRIVHPLPRSPQPLDLDLSEEKVLSVLEFSSHGAARSDQGARMLRSEPQQAFLGEVLEDCPFVQGDCCGGILY